MIAHGGLERRNMITDLRRADLRRSDLRRADLRRANLGEAVLDGAERKRSNHGTRQG